MRCDCTQCPCNIPIREGKECVPCWVGEHLDEETGERLPRVLSSPAGQSHISAYDAGMSRCSVCGGPNGQHAFQCPIHAEEHRLELEEQSLDTAARLPLESRVAALTREQTQWLADADTFYTEIEECYPTEHAERVEHAGPMGDGLCPTCRGALDDHYGAERCQ